MQRLLTHEEFIGYLKGSIIKYRMREGFKEGTDDREKALQYSYWLSKASGEFGADNIIDPEHDSIPEWWEYKGI